MDKIKVRLLNESRMKGFTGFDHPYISLCGRDDDGELCQLESWATCRETIMCHVRNKYKPSPYNTKAEKLATDRIRVISYVKQTIRAKAPREERKLVFEAALNNAIKILNFFEEMGHLKRSKLYEVEHGLPVSHFIYLIEGSSEWLRSPALLSLYLLLIRCGRFLELGKFTTYEEFMERCRHLVKNFEKDTKNMSFYEKRTYLSSFPEGNSRDFEYLKYVAHKLPVLMKERKKLFSKTKPEDHFAQSGYSDGIHNLITGTTKDKNLSKRFVESCDAYEIEADKPFI